MVSAWPLLPGSLRVPNGYLMTTSLSLVSELERIASAVESDATALSQISLSGIAERIAKNLGVKRDEIALMGVSTRWRHLHFLVPESLKQVGFIPLSSTPAIAARTARESRPDIINNFASVRHATVFEGVKVGGETSELIQKMISAPILSGDKVVGVIQISRKGANAKVAGPDFSADDLGRVLALCKPLAAKKHRIRLTVQYLLVIFQLRNVFRLTPLAEAPQPGTMAFVAKKIFLTKGVGKHRERLSSFELALRNAGIAACNIVRVSSIFPPNCKLISRSEGLKHIKPGQVAFTVISENSTKEAHRLIAASIGLALPSDKSMYGYLSEHHSFGETEEVAGEYAEELAAEMLATTLNVEFDPDLSWDEKKEVYRISNKIVRTVNLTQSAVGDKRGLWTTVLGAAILIGGDDD